MLQQGDIQLIQTLNGGDIIVDDGVFAMEPGLCTMIYLTLFGGNRDDDGSDRTSLQWWGNLDEQEPSRRYRSRTQFLFDGLPVTAANLRKLVEAAEFDLQVFITEGIVEEINVTAELVEAKRVDLQITGFAEGEPFEFNFSENWAEGSCPPEFTGRVFSAPPTEPVDPPVQTKYTDDTYWDPDNDFSWNDVRDSWDLNAFPAPGQSANIVVTASGPNVDWHVGFRPASARIVVRSPSSTSRTSSIRMAIIDEDGEVIGSQTQDLQPPDTDVEYSFPLTFQADDISELQMRRMVSESSLPDNGEAYISCIEFFPPAPPEYQVFFDDTYWEPFGVTSWDGTQWVIDGGATWPPFVDRGFGGFSVITTGVNANWSDGLRPTRLRATVRADVSVTDLTLNITGANGSQTQSLAAGVDTIYEFDLTYGTDIRELEIYLESFAQLPRIVIANLELEV